MADNPFDAMQHKIFVLADVGIIDPLDLDAYRARGGYKGLERALAMTPDEIIAEVEKSGLRGKGGAGFPTGRKWRTAAGYDNFPKYIVCNGDEGDPGAFMDGSTMEGCPHCRHRGGMTMAALAVGAQKRAILDVRDGCARARSSGIQTRHPIRRDGVPAFSGEHVLGTDHWPHAIHISARRRARSSAARAAR